MMTDRPLTYDEAYPNGDDGTSATGMLNRRSQLEQPPTNGKMERASGASKGMDLLAGLRDGAWLDAQTFPDLRYAVFGVFPEGLTLFVAPPKSGKTHATTDVALAIACGGVALGRIRTGAPRPVFGLFLEDSDSRVQQRCRRNLADAPIPALFQYMTRVQPGRALDTLRCWFAKHADREPVGILDPLGKVMPPALLGESAYQRDYRIGSELKRIVDDVPGSSLIVCHHDRKAGSDDFVDNVSGTNGLAGSADTVVVLSRARNETTGRVKVTGRDVLEREIAVKFVDGFWQLHGDDLDAASRRAVELRSTSTLGDRSLDVLAFVHRHPEGVAPKDVDAALKMTDAKVYLGRLYDTHRITKLRRGVYAPLTEGTP